MYEVKGGGNITEKGLKRGMPVYECTVCRNRFGTSSVVFRENNVTGIIGTVVYSFLLAAGIIFFLDIPVIYKLFFLTIPGFFLIIGLRKIVNVFRMLSRYENERGNLVESGGLSGLNENFSKERKLEQKQVA
jgi:hypothetical protein